MTSNNEDSEKTFLDKNNDDQEFHSSGNDPVTDIQRQFLYAAEKCSKDIELISTQEKALLMDIKESLPLETRKALSAVKLSMQMMHAKFAKELDINLNEVQAVLTRIERAYEDIQELRQWTKSDMYNTGMQDYSQALLERKEAIEGMIKNTISELNDKRQKDEQLFSEFSDNIHGQVTRSVEVLELCLQKSAKRRKSRMDCKIVELENVLFDLKKFG